MPFKKNSDGSTSYDSKGTMRIQGARGGLFNRTVDVVRDTAGRPLRWNENINDFEVDTKKWLEEKSNDES